jgi:hypothetical protein
LEFYLARLFGKNDTALENAIATAPLKPSIPLASDNDVQKCAELLAKSQRPVMLIGSQTLLPPIDQWQLQKAVEVSLLFAFYYCCRLSYFAFRQSAFRVF